MQQVDQREQAEDHFMHMPEVCYMRLIATEPRIFCVYNGDGEAIAVGSLFSLTQLRIDVGLVELTVH